MKKLFPVCALALLPLPALANMNGAHFESQSLNNLVAGVVIVLVLNTMLTIGNIWWKKPALTVLNSILTMPLVLLSILLFANEEEVGLIPSAVVVAHFIMIKKSIKEEPVL